MSRALNIRILAPRATALACAVVLMAAGLAEAQSTRRTGGGFSRSGGPAAFGGFSGRTADPANTAARQTGATERTEARQAGASERTETRQTGATERTEARTSAATDIANTRSNTVNNAIDTYDDNHWVGGWGTAAAVGVTAVGAAAATTTTTTTVVVPTTTYVATLPCQATVIVAGGKTYYQCGSAWYGRTYVNNEVVYVVVPPPGAN